MVPCQREMCNAALAFRPTVSLTRERHVVSLRIALDVSDPTIAAFITAVTIALGYDTTTVVSANACGRTTADIIVCETRHEPGCDCDHLPRIVLTQTLTMDSATNRALPAGEMCIAWPVSAQTIREALADLT